MRALRGVVLDVPPHLDAPSQQQTGLGFANPGATGLGPEVEHRDCPGREYVLVSRIAPDWALAARSVRTPRHFLQCFTLNASVAPASLPGPGRCTGGLGVRLST